VLERYLAELHAELAGRQRHSDNIDPLQQLEIVPDNPLPHWGSSWREARLLLPGLDRQVINPATQTFLERHRVGQAIGQYSVPAISAVRGRGAGDGGGGGPAR
jgi:hypothetical protein